jgi:hypothetical protein
MRGAEALVTTLTVAVGFVAATWLLGPPPSPLVAWCSAAAAATVVALCLSPWLGQRRYWGVHMVGLYLVAAPILVGFADEATPLWSHFLSGVGLATVGFAAAPELPDDTPTRRRRCHARERTP